LQLIVLPEQLRQVFGAFEMFWKISGWNCPVAPPPGCGPNDDVLVARNMCDGASAVFPQGFTEDEQASRSCCALVHTSAQGFPFSTLILIMNRFFTML